MKAPNINKHFYISITKSIVRVVSCILCFKFIIILPIGLIVAELLGVVEEIL